MAEATFNHQTGVFEVRPALGETFEPTGLTWDRTINAWTTPNPAIGRRYGAPSEDVLTAQRERDRRILNSSSADAGIELIHPPDYSYFPFQRSGIAQMLERPATLLGDEMGVGKTIQIIGVINNDESIKRALIVCPASLKLNWAKELSRWLTRRLTYQVAISKLFPRYSDIIIINYDILDKFKKELQAVSWDLIAGDEAHMIKKPTIKRAKAFYSLSAPRRILATGTAIENLATDVYALAHWLAPRMYPSGKGFKKLYEGPEGEKALQQDLRGTILIRRLKCEVTGLPPKVRQVIELPATGVEKIVQAEVEEYQRRYLMIQELEFARDRAKEAGNNDEYKRIVRELKQAVMVAFTELAEYRKNTAIAKLPFLIQHVDNILTQEPKVVVFLHHHVCMDAVAKHFGPERCVMFTGRISQLQRDMAIQRFQEDDTCKVICVSIEAGGVGITLTAARVGVFGELVWKPSTLSQAEDRLHRIGQRDSVLIQHVVLEGSVDAMMADKIITKQDIIQRALNHIKQ